MAMAFIPGFHSLGNLVDLVVLKLFFVVVDPLAHLVQFVQLIIFVILPYRVFFLVHFLVPVKTLEILSVVIRSVWRVVGLLRFIELEKLFKDDGLFPILFEWILTIGLQLH